MFKILSKRKYEDMQQEIIDYHCDKTTWREDEKTYLKQVEYLQSKIKENEKEIKRLKGLLTKNGVKYKKEEKNNTKKTKKAKSK